MESESSANWNQGKLYHEIQKQDISINKVTYKTSLP